MKSEFEKLTFEDLLNWLDRPEGAMLELYPHEVKECREMLTEFKQDLNKVKQDLNKVKQELEEYRCALHMAVLLIESVTPPRCSTYLQRFLNAKNIEKNILDSVREELQRKQKAREE